VSLKVLHIFSLRNTVDTEWHGRASLYVVVRDQSDPRFHSLNPSHPIGACYARISHVLSVQEL
jgi:hypothetical protein